MSSCNVCVLHGNGFWCSVCLVIAGFDWVYTDLATLRIRGMLTCKPQLLKPVRMDG